MISHGAGASLTLDKDGRFRLVVKKLNSISIRYPEIILKKNRVKVGCITITKAAARKLLAYTETGYLQAEG